MDEGVLEKEFKVVVDKFEKGGWFKVYCYLYIYWYEKIIIYIDVWYWWNKLIFINIVKCLF